MQAQKCLKSCLQMALFAIAALTLTPEFARVHATEPQGLVPLTNVNTFPNNGRQSETTIAVNPTDGNNIIAGANIISAGTTKSGTPPVTSSAVNGAQAIFFSKDGGLTWAQAATPPPFTTDRGHTFSSSGDPRLEFDNQGNAFCAYLLFDRDPKLKPAQKQGGALVVSKSTDGGNNWNAPVAVVDHTDDLGGPAGFEDHESMAIDKKDGTIYVSWTHFNKRIPLTPLVPGDEIFISKSKDGDRSWEPQISVSGLLPDSVQDSMTAVSKNGDVYVTWIERGKPPQEPPSKILITRFLLGGSGPPLPPVTVGSSNIIMPFTDPITNVTTKFNVPAQPDRAIAPSPSVACDSKDANTIYVAWPDMGANGSTDVDIFLRKSIDAGVHWDAIGRKRVNNDPANSNASQFNCAMAIDPDNNSINISYYDTRRDSSNQKTDYFLSRSTDGGQNFTETRITTAQSDESTSNATRDTGNNYGDYSGIAARGGFVFPCWADNRTVTEKILTGPTTENIFVARMGACSDAVTFKVTTTEEDKQGSLRQALAQAGTCGHIIFNIPTTDKGFISDVFIFQPLTDYPPISADNITIDGNTENTFLGSNQNPMHGPSIIINGAAPFITPILSISNGLTVSAGVNETFINDLAIGAFPENGIAISGTKTRVSNCWIGPDRAGGKSPNKIGVMLFAGANESSIELNNVISGNTKVGIQVDSDDNLISLNRIGTNNEGNTALGNTGGGILISGKRNLIGKDGEGRGGLNIISGNSGSGILIQGNANMVGANRIGTDASGLRAIGNTGNGITIDTGADNVIGRTKQGGGGANLISGNKNTGVVITNKAQRNIVAGNYIGVDITGNAPLPNQFDGVYIRGDSVGNQIGDSSPRMINIISGNGGNGISIFHSDRNRVQRNLIGTQSNGTGSLPNQSHGILIAQKAAGNIIGAGSETDGNVIAFNKLNGISIESGGIGDPQLNTITHNSIFSNEKIGINLVGGTEDSRGVTANDSGDADSGGNGLQNSPTLVRFRQNGLTVEATLNSIPNSSFIIEVFANKGITTNSPAQGETFVKKIDSVTTDASGNASFIFSVPSRYLTMPLTATATAPDGNTSEFSNTLYSNYARSSFWDRVGHAIVRTFDAILRGLGLRHKPTPAPPKP